MNNNYQTIHSSEIDDFKKSCQRYSINYAEFNFYEHDITQSPAGNGLYYSHGKVTITRNGKNKTYRTGHGSKWPADVDIDLNNDFFK